MGATTEQPSIHLAERLSLGVEETATVVGCSPNYIRNLIGPERFRTLDCRPCRVTTGAAGSLSPLTPSRP